MSPKLEGNAMTSPTTSDSGAGARAYTDVMTVPPPASDATAGLLDFVFGEMWLRPGLGMRAAW